MQRRLGRARLPLRLAAAVAWHVHGVHAARLVLDTAGARGMTPRSLVPQVLRQWQRLARTLRPLFMPLLMKPHVLGPQLAGEGSLLRQLRLQAAAGLLLL